MKCTVWRSRLQERGERPARLILGKRRSCSEYSILSARGRTDVQAPTSSRVAIEYVGWQGKNTLRARGALPAQALKAYIDMLCCEASSSKHKHSPTDSQES